MDWLDERIVEMAVDRDLSLDEHTWGQDDRDFDNDRYVRGVPAEPRRTAASPVPSAHRTRRLSCAPPPHRHRRAGDGRILYGATKHPSSPAT